MANTQIAYITSGALEADMKKLQKDYPILCALAASKADNVVYRKERDQKPEVKQKQKEYHQARARQQKAEAAYIQKHGIDITA